MVMEDGNSRKKKLRSLKYSLNIKCIHGSVMIYDITSCISPALKARA